MLPSGPVPHDESHSKYLICDLSQQSRILLQVMHTHTLLFYGRQTCASELNFSVTFVLQLWIFSRYTKLFNTAKMNVTESQQLIGYAINLVH